MEAAITRHFRPLLLLAAFSTIYACLFYSLYAASWFSWSSNALSDLGHSTRSEVAAVYNFGLLGGGLLLALYSVAYLRSETKIAWIFMLATGFSLQLVAAYDEVYGFLHWLVSVLLFGALGVSILIYGLERRSRLSIPVFSLYMAVWAAFYLDMLGTGVSVPELAVSLLSSIFFIWKEAQMIQFGG